LSSHRGLMRLGWGGYIVRLLMLKKIKELPEGGSKGMEFPREKQKFSAKQS